MLLIYLLLKLDSINTLANLCCKLNLVLFLNKIETYFSQICYELNEKELG